MPVNFEKAISPHILNRIRNSASSDYVAGTMYTKHFKKMITNVDETGMLWKNTQTRNTHIQE